MKSLVQIDLKNLRHNFNYLKSKTNKKIICVVKSDAYGHGMLKVANVCKELGAFGFAVCEVSDGVKLRRGGVSSLILVTGRTSEKDFPLLNKYNLCQSCFSYEYALNLQSFFSKIDKKVNVHLKIDTGMRRFGYSVKSNEIYKIMETKDMKNIAITGLYTHFSRADEVNCTYTLRQYNDFLTVVNLFDKSKILLHTSNSSAFINFPNLNENAVRLGIALYGFGDNNLKPLVKFTTKIEHFLNVYKGDSVGYGSIYTATENGKIAIIPIGYFNGFNPPSEKFYVRINGAKFPIVGKVCMNHSFVDMKNAAVKIGDEVTVLDDVNDIKLLSEVQNKSVYNLLCDINRLNAKKYIN